MRLWQEGWFQSSAEPSGVSTLRNPKVCADKHTPDRYLSNVSAPLNGKSRLSFLPIGKTGSYVNALGASTPQPAGFTMHANINTGCTKGKAVSSLFVVHRQEPKNERPVIVAGKDQGEVDNDYLLLPVNILDHEGPLSSSFPIENRLLPQGDASHCMACWAITLCQACPEARAGFP